MLGPNHGGRHRDEASPIILSDLKLLRQWVELGNELFDLPLLSCCGVASIRRATCHHAIDGGKNPQGTCNAPATQNRPEKVEAKKEHTVETNSSVKRTLSNCIFQACATTFQQINNPKNCATQRSHHPQ